MPASDASAATSAERAARADRARRAARRAAAARRARASARPAARRAFARRTRRRWRRRPRSSCRQRRRRRGRKVERDVGDRRTSAPRAPRASADCAGAEDQRDVDHRQREREHREDRQPDLRIDLRQDHLEPRAHAAVAERARERQAARARGTWCSAPTIISTRYGTSFSSRPSTSATAARVADGGHVGRQRPSRSARARPRARSSPTARSGTRGRSRAPNAASRGSARATRRPRAHQRPRRAPHAQKPSASASDSAVREQPMTSVRRSARAQSRATRASARQGSSANAWPPIAGR